jgi:hypothetical protein
LPRSAIAQRRVAKTARFARYEDAAHISEMITGMSTEDRVYRFLLMPRHFLAAC